jgi:hypothetical protein
MKALYLLLGGLALFAASPANAQCAVDIFGLVSGCPPPTVTTPPTPTPPPGCADFLCGPTGQVPTGGAPGVPAGAAVRGSTPPPCETNMFGALVC